jgi:hypothetical protein
MLFINKKFFFINNLKHNILNNNYLFFFYNKINSLNYNTLDIKMLQANNLKKLNINNNNFLLKNTKILLLNNLTSEINIKDISFVSYLGYFINNNYKNKLLNYNLFFSNNFKAFIYMIFINIYTLKFILF